MRVVDGRVTARSSVAGRGARRQSERLRTASANRAIRLGLAFVAGSLLAGSSAAAQQAAAGSAAAEGASGAAASAAAAATPAAGAPVSGGAALFQRYCASCHGASGRGDGPVAAQLARPPANLATLARRNGGRLDEAALIAVIDGRRAVAAHGSREMPVWGDVFDAELAGQPYRQRQSLLRAQVLADYIRTLQER